METMFRKNLTETILWKIGMDNLMEQLWRASESRIAKQIRLAARNTNKRNNPLVRQVRTNEVSERGSAQASAASVVRTLASLSKAKTA